MTIINLATIMFFLKRAPHPLDQWIDKPYLKGSLLGFWKVTTIRFFLMLKKCMDKHLGMSQLNSTMNTRTVDVLMVQGLCSTYFSFDVIDFELFAMDFT